MSTTTPNYLEAGHILSAYGDRLAQEGNDAGSQQALKIAMSIAKHERNLVLEIMTLINAASADAANFRLQESLEKSLRAIELAQSVADPLPDRAALAYLHSLRFEYNRADLAAAWRYAETYQTLCERTGVPAFLAGSLYASAKVAALGGEWQRARSFFERGVRELPDLAQTLNAFMLIAVQTLVEYAVGDFKQGEALLSRLLEILHSAPPEPGWVHLFVSQTIAISARVSGTMHYFDVAREAAETVLASQRVSPWFTWFARTSLALLAVQQEDTRAVQEQYTSLLKGERAFLLMDGDRLLGILAAAIGELDQAATHFEAALAIWGKGRYPEHAWTAYDFADTLLQRGHPGDNNRATTLLDEALSISDELGMNPLKERVLLRQASLKS